MKLARNDPQNGGERTGYFDPVDRDGDGRTDLMFLSGVGLVLKNGLDGFTSVPVGQEGEEYAFSLAAAAPIIDAEKTAAFIGLQDGNKMLVENDSGDVIDITRYGNEIQDDAPGMFMTLAEDLTADGRIDL